MTHVCDIVVVPVATPPESREDFLAVLFEEVPDAATVGPATRGEAASVGAGDEGAADQARVRKLDDELKATKEYLGSLIEEHQRTNEELLSANEELISSNEELQTLNEELETAKEELQSTNEELRTLNEEQQSRNVEVTSVNADLVNILGSVEVPIVIVDARRCIRRFTPKARPILNLLPSDVGRPIDDIKPTVAIDDLDRKISDVIDTAVLHEEEVRGPDGRWYRLQIRPYKTLDMRVDGAVVSIIDIDALKRALGAAEWARDYAKATVEAVPTPLLVLDDRLRVFSANAAFHESFRLSRGESDGRDLSSVMGGAWDVPELRYAVERALKNDERFEKLVLERALPRLGLRSVSLSGRSISTPSGERLVLLAPEDVTDRLRREEERASLLEATQSAKAAAEAANRTKDVFLATLSHELRTPLSSVLAQAQLLRRGTPDEERVHRASEIIERSVRLQAQLIDDLLDVSRIVAGKLKMQLQSVHLASVVRAAVEALGPSAEAKHIDVELRLDDSVPPVSGDPVRLQQVISNLLTNAIKFTPPRGRIVASVDSAEGLGRVQVADTGSGIDPAFMPHIFRRFAQEERGQAPAHGGLGLGLTIAHHLVEAHGGTLFAESAGKERGATFTVLVPLMRASLGPQPVLAPASRSLAGARVLFVEDDAGTREAVSEMLGIGGAEVQLAASARDAFRVLESFAPDVLICDIAMPEEDGFSLLRRVRAMPPPLGRVPAIALTSLAGEADRRRALEAGFQRHVAKPVAIERLTAEVAGLLGASIT
ncbi:MAG: PAS domain-containing protein [Deltaproteobacteria bacterium]|nr:PAS domain-containing protein [Deltaproteobacteria bacterium]